MSARPSTPAIYALAGAAAVFGAALFVPAAAHAEGDRVIGPVTSVSGNTFEVARPAGATTVAFTDATRIVEPVPAQLGEITAGTCIRAGATLDSAPADSGAISAKWVAISAPVDGKCPQRPGGADAPAPPAPHRGVRGVVDSVAGNTVTVTGASGQTTTVTVTDDTHLRRMVTVGAGVISAGKCVAARGTRDGDGVLQATRVSVWAPDGDACPEPAV
ncbi:DUF5666 domain-containing protein [Mycolicibacter sinensis]|uniref:DUF5666 domain-containing protein n=1 Tax=Mycolicibacter sinensis (strain JDM601) TaxID=875328 RepID=UPI0007EA9CA3|nr:DUF5666 domain-containing protein [Mycolicibacter sinensis]OBH19932.1 hypothetical protein A5694_01125 [Mycolicibacter sinensis]